VPTKDRWKRDIKIRQSYICLICGKKGTDKTLNIHHKKAKKYDGTNDPENVVAWHKTCHNRYHQENRLQESDDFGNPI